VLCTGHLGKQIQDTFGDGSKYGLRIRYSQEDKPLGTAGALKNADLYCTIISSYVRAIPIFRLISLKSHHFVALRNKLGLDTRF